MKIGIITCGGDSPGMNPCIARIVTIANEKNHKVIGYKSAFHGIMEHNFIELIPITVQGWYKLGGTMLKTGRMPELKNTDRQIKIITELKNNGIDSLIILGGDGSFRAAADLDSHQSGLNFFGIPCTIDNNIYGSDYTLGHDTALNKLVNYIDDISDTGMALPGRVFFVETLGGDNDWIPYSAIKMGMADFCVLTGYSMTNEQICAKVQECLTEKRRDYVLGIFAEEPQGLMMNAAQFVREKLHVSVKCNMIGYQQRGGTPTALERLHASEFASCALQALEDNLTGKYVVYKEGNYCYMNLACAGKKKTFKKS